MRRRPYLDIALPLTLLGVATAVIAANGWDLQLASLFYSPVEGWKYGKDQPWKFLYEHGPKIPVAAAVAAAAVFVAGLRKRSFARWRKASIFTVLLLVIGPGLIVNPILKDHWGRPRPRQVEQFGGKMPFHEVWQPGRAGKGKSFPCGHASGAFFFVAPYFILRRRHPRRALLFLFGGLGFGTLMGAARIIQGGHFLSDVVWSAGIVYLTAAALAYLLKLDGVKPAAVPDGSTGATRDENQEPSQSSFSPTPVEVFRGQPFSDRAR